MATKHTAAAVAILAAFYAHCVRYASLVGIWGDEVFTVEHAEKSWATIWNTWTVLDPVHLPTYIGLLKLVLGALGESDFGAIRLIYATIFTGGLAFGYRAASRLLGPRRALLALLAAAVIPAFAFYATNVRLYSWLFLASMWYVDRLTIVVLAAPAARRRDWAWLLVSGMVLILTDYPGVFLVGTGALWLAATAPVGRRFRSFCAGLSPLLALTLFVAGIWLSVQRALGSNVRGGGRVATISEGGFDLFALAKQGFVALRPVWELTSPARGSLILAFGPPALALGALLGLALAAIVWRRKTSRATAFALSLALYWVLLIPIGYSVPRVVLPCLFFAGVALLADPPGGRPWLRGGARAALAALVAANLLLVFSPSLRFYSRIPTEDILADTASALEAAGTRDLRQSQISLNDRALERRFERDDRFHGVRLGRITPETAPDDLPAGSFVYLSHLPENLEWFDPARFEEDFGRKVRRLRTYVSIEESGMNALWRRQLRQRAGAQPYLFALYEVGPSVGGSAGPGAGGGQSSASGSEEPSPP